MELVLIMRFQNQEFQTGLESSRLVPEAGDGMTLAVVGCSGGRSLMTYGAENPRKR